MKNIFTLFLIINFLLLFSCKKEIIQYNLTSTVNPLNSGTISPASGTYENGQNISLLATPNGEYIFKEWQGDLISNSNPATVLIDKNKSVSGRFEKRQYPLNLTIEGSGAVKEEIISLATNSQYPSGTTVKLTPQPVDGWKFNNWTGDVSNSDNPLTLIINKPFSLKVTFSILDEDLDGINDFLDKCPSTPKNENANSNGCSISQIDTDGDGVFDNKDQDNSTRKGVPVDENGRMLNPIYLAQNGVTIKAFDWAIVGDKGIVNGKEYKIITREELDQIIKSEGDYSLICTSKISSLKNLFVQYSSTYPIPKYLIKYDVSSWDVSNVTTMESTFINVTLNYDISNWDVSSVKLMKFLFSESKFNGNISNWNVSNVESMEAMFANSSFNGDVSNWNVGNVKDMNGMFMGAVFNGNICNWNVSNVESMSAMFLNASNFNQDLSKWNVSNVLKCSIFNSNTPSWTLPKPNFTNCSY